MHLDGVEVSERAQQEALAHTAGSAHKEDVARVHCEADAVDDRPVAKRSLEAVDFQQWRARHQRPDLCAVAGKRAGQRRQVLSTGSEVTPARLESADPVFSQVLYPLSARTYVTARPGWSAGVKHTYKRSYVTVQAEQISVPLALQVTQ